MFDEGAFEGKRVFVIVEKIKIAVVLGISIFGYIVWRTIVVI